MPAFGIGINNDNLDSGNINGKIVPIACKVWFTTEGTPMPLSFKYEDHEGVIQTVDNLRIKFTEDKYYSGIPSKEYRCRSIINGVVYEFKLIYYVELCKWVMVI